MGKVVSILSLKGGVGKTTIATTLASSLARTYGKKVLLVDANYAAPNVGIHMDILCPKQTIHDVLAGAKVSSAVHQRYGVDVIPGNFHYSRTIDPLRLRAKLGSVKKNYDFIILDSAPTLDEEFLSALFASDESFLITTSDYPTLSCTMKVAKFARQRSASLGGIIVNRVVDPSLQVGLREIQESASIPVVLSIKEDKRVLRALFSRIPVTFLAPRSSMAREMNKLAGSLVGEREKKTLFQRLGRAKESLDQTNRDHLRKRFYTSIFNE